MHWRGRNSLPPELFSDGEFGGSLYLLKCKGCLAIKKKRIRSTASALCTKIVLFCDGAVRANSVITIKKKSETKYFSKRFPSRAEGEPRVGPNRVSQYPSGRGGEQTRKNPNKTQFHFREIPSTIADVPPEGRGPGCGLQKKF